MQQVTIQNGSTIPFILKAGEYIKITTRQAGRLHVKTKKGRSSRSTQASASMTFAPRLARATQRSVLRRHSS